MQRPCLPADQAVPAAGRPRLGEHNRQQCWPAARVSLRWRAGASPLLTRACCCCARPACGWVVCQDRQDAADPSQLAADGAMAGQGGTPRKHQFDDEFMMMCYKVSSSIARTGVSNVGLWDAVQAADRACSTLPAAWRGRSQQQHQRWCLCAATAAAAGAVAAASQQQHRSTTHAALAHAPHTHASQQLH